MPTGADCVVAIGSHVEACPNGLAPTCSTAVKMAVGDAVAMLASRLREFTPQDFARFHPGGALGRKLANARQMMRPLSACRIASQDVTIREAMVVASKSGRRSGAIMLVDDRGRLSGIFTDSDLARLLEARRDETLDEPIRDSMTDQPTTAEQTCPVSEVIAVMSKQRISELPVIDDGHRPVGMLDITDLVTQQDDAPRTLPLQ